MSFQITIFVVVLFHPGQGGKEDINLNSSKKSLLGEKKSFFEHQMKEDEN